MCTNRCVLSHKAKRTTEKRWNATTTKGKETQKIEEDSRRSSFSVVVVPSSSSLFLLWWWWFPVRRRKKETQRPSKERERSEKPPTKEREIEEEPPHGERWRHGIATKRKNKGGLSPSVLCGFGGAFSTLSLCNGGSFLPPLSHLWCGRLSRPSTTLRERWTVRHHVKTRRRRPQTREGETATKRKRRVEPLQKKRRREKESTNTKMEVKKLAPKSERDNHKRESGEDFHFKKTMRGRRNHRKERERANHQFPLFRWWLLLLLSLFFSGGGSFCLLLFFLWCGRLSRLPSTTKLRSAMGYTAGTMKWLIIS